MAQGSIIFVHGTGVRLSGYRESFALAKTKALKVGIGATFIDCAWGDLFGAEFKGLSLPGPATAEQMKAHSEDHANWSWRYDDPLHELDAYADVELSPDREIQNPGTQEHWEVIWDKLMVYQLSAEVEALLGRAGISRAEWTVAWENITGASSPARQAFERSQEELEEVCKALIYALVAELHRSRVSNGMAPLSRHIRASLVERLEMEWEAETLWFGKTMTSVLGRIASNFLQRKRNSLSEVVAPLIGDILLYQSRGKMIRDYIDARIKGAAAPVTLIAHSLGGIACFDLLAGKCPPQVACLVTVGSQAPLLYELGALSSLAANDALPPTFPRWLNIYDRSDMLSYAAEKLFPAAKDIEIDTEQLPMAAHSAYFENDDVWAEIAAYMNLT